MVDGLVDRQSGAEEVLDQRPQQLGDLLRLRRRRRPQVDALEVEGPEGGERGGTIVGAGTPEKIATLAESYTGRYLQPLLSK